MQATLSGRCFCGAVAYRIANSEIRDFYVCECAQCRRLTGTGSAANLVAEPAAITWYGDRANIRRYDAEDGRGFTRVFCQRCASPLPFINVAGNALIIPAGSLDGVAPLAVKRRIFTAERAEWLSPESSLPAYPGLPPAD